MTNDNRLAISAVARGALVGMAVVVSAGASTVLAMLLVFVAGLLAFPVAGLLAVAGPAAGALLSGRIAGPVSVGFVAVAATVTYVSAIVLSWRLGFPLVQVDAIDPSVFVVGVLAPTFAASWLVAALSGFRLARPLLP